ncbi:type IV secretory system conjugative DNA transfer family protein [Vibrio fortis]|uniref:type IV secretory system conjugative DNA transfer family protein n=1 Tax=Vibrio fortis TaxID=212667 RepID=UPI004069905C
MDIEVSAIQDALSGSDSDELITNDSQRRAIGSFSPDETIRKFVLSDAVVSNGVDIDGLTFGNAIRFEHDSLLSLKKKFVENTEVQERVEKQRESGNRGAILFNEGLTYGAQAALASTLMMFESGVFQKRHELLVNYDFDGLMLHGGTVLPPIINLYSGEKTVEDRLMKKVSARYELRQQAKFVTKSPTILDYLSFEKYPVKEPSPISIPYTKNETTHWAQGVIKGWKLGERQAYGLIDSAIAKLDRDRLGMLRYHEMRKRNMVSDIKVSKMQSSVAGTGTELIVGESQLMLTQLPRFILSGEDWTPIQKLDELEYKHLINK